jgi:transposase-like protein
MKHTHRPRQTPEQIQSLVTQFHQSELSSTAFCKKHGLAYSSFYAWCKKYSVVKSATLNRYSPPAAHFIDLQAMATQPHGAWNIVLKLGNGVELQLSQA